ncbi:secreted RxLR effector protein 161-like [Juglans regia]|uniref:Secreted RxLR effector protein 161-like n=1 Tax=Juglans regia TaxID=51240 RepID=A0A6P9E0T3_JUGRE|nr:secreted RxLR effector protein 161-like [Juglans regia]
MNTSVKLSNDGSGKNVEQSLYRSIIGSLLYLTASRPDIAFSVGYSRDSNTELVSYSDADWAGNADDRKSTSGGYFYVGTNLVAWMSKKQNSR